MTPVEVVDGPGKAPRQSGTIITAAVAALLGAAVGVARATGIDLPPVVDELQEPVALVLGALLAYFLRRGISRAAAVP